MKNLKTKSSFLVATLLVASFILLGTGIQTAKAVTLDELQAQIEALMAQITELRQEKARLEQGQTWCHDFNINLKFGDNGNEITALETALQKQNFSVHISSSNSKGTFDAKIASAVVGFQEKYKQDILGPYNLQHGTGYVGPTTRTKLNELYGCDNAPSTCNNRNISIWDWDYCTPECPCDIDEGDCDTDADCNGDYHCVMDVGTDYGQDSEMDVCQSRATTPSITITSPDSGEQWIAGQTYDIKWIPTSVDDVKQLSILLVKGVYVTETIASMGTITDFSNTFSWTIPNNVTIGTDYRIRFFYGDRNLKTSDYFAIVAGSTTPTSCDERSLPLWDWDYCTPECPCNAGEGDCDTDADCIAGHYCQHSSGINVCRRNKTTETQVIIAPGGGDVWGIGQTYTIKWDTANIVEKFNIYLSSDSYSKIIIAKDVDASLGEYTWKVPSMYPKIYPSKGCDYRIMFYPSFEKDPSKKIFATSGYFKIVFSLTSCHPGPLWSRNYCSSSCRCSVGEGPCEQNIDCVTGYCAKNIGPKYGQGIWVNVCEAYTGENPTLKVLSPNGGEQVTINQFLHIEWFSYGISYVKVYLENLETGDSFLCGGFGKDGMIKAREENYIFWNLIKSRLPDNFNFPGKYRIKIVGINSERTQRPIITDYSDAYFDIEDKLREKGVCIDSDGGKNYFVKGTATEGTSWTDYCCSDYCLKEYYCANNEKHSDLYTCPDDSVCKDGACIDKITSIKSMDKQLASASDAISQLIENIKKLIGK